MRWRQHRPGPKSFSYLGVFWIISDKPSYHVVVSSADLGIFRRAAMVVYTDCIQQCSRPLYMVRAYSCVPWPPPREQGTSRRGRLREVIQLPKTQRARWPRGAEVQSGGRSMLFILLVHKKIISWDGTTFVHEILLVYKKEKYICIKLLNSDCCCGERSRQVSL